MTPQERADLLARLAGGRDALAAALEGMSDAEAAAPGPEGRWSALGNVEHLALAESFMMGGAMTAQPSLAEAAPGNEEQIFARVKARRRTATAPPATAPTGASRSVAEALARFDAVRAETVRFVESTPHDPRRCMTTHPLLGPITVMECLSLVAAHPYRHADQIRELRGLPRLNQ